MKTLNNSSNGGVHFGMKRILVGLTALSIAIVIGITIYLTSSSRNPGRVDALKIITAAKTYTASLKAQSLPVPASVSLQELISKKLLNASDVSGFTGMEVTVNLSANEAHPQDVLIRARLADGHEIVALADGSVQQVAK